MPQYYGGTQGPAQYAMHQQSRQDQQMSQLLRMFMMMKQSKQRGSEWEQDQALKEKKFNLSGEQLKSLDRSRRAQEKQQEAYRKYQEAQMKRWGAEPTPEEQATRDLELFTKKEAVKAAFKAPATTKTKADPRIKNRLGIVEDAIELYEGTLKDLKTDMTTDPTILNNINYALEELYGAKTRLGDNKLIEGKQWNTVRRISASPSYVKSGSFLKGVDKEIPQPEVEEFLSMQDLPPGAQTATHPKTGERVALINGKWIQIK